MKQGSVVPIRRDDIPEVGAVYPVQTVARLRLYRVAKASSFRVVLEPLAAAEEVAALRAWRAQLEAATAAGAPPVPTADEPAGAA